MERQKLQVELGQRQARLPCSVAAVRMSASTLVQLWPSMPVIWNAVTAGGQVVMAAAAFPAMNHWQLSPRKVHGRLPIAAIHADDTSSASTIQTDALPV